MDNDILPPGYGGWLFAREPPAQVAASDRKRGDTLDQLPLLKEVVERLDKKIAFYDSAAAVPDDVLDDPEKFMHVIAANKQTIYNLQGERSFILGRIDSI